MANIDIEVAGRRYNVSCRDGEEEHLHSVAAEVDRRAQDATAALGSLSETRQLLFAALLIADDIKELQKELRAIGRRLDRIEESLPKKRGGGSSKRGSKS